MERDLVTECINNGTKAQLEDFVPGLPLHVLRANSSNWILPVYLVLNRDLKVGRIHH
jgi:hypothetical protein